MKLYEIHKQTEALFERLSGADAETSEAIAAELQDMQMAWDEKLIACCAYIKNLDAEITAYDAEIDRLTQKRDSLKTSYERFKGYLARFAPRTKWSNGVHTLSWRASKSVEILDDKLIPAAFKREIWKLRWFWSRGRSSRRSTC